MDGMGYEKNDFSSKIWQKTWDWQAGKNVDAKQKM